MAGKKRILNFDFTKYNKITLFGNNGSGKSWLAKRIAKITGYPLFHLDNELWKPDWIMPPEEEILKKTKEMMNNEQWIIDGNWNYNSMEMRCKEADLIIHLNINRFICLLSVIKRRNQKRSDFPEFLNHTKSPLKTFLHFYKGIWSYPKNRQKRVAALHDKCPDKKFLQIKKRRDVKKFINSKKIIDNLH